MNSKKTMQDVKLGRIYRCSLCDAKCDDTWGTKQGKMICGRFVEKENYSIMQCSKDCHFKHLRDKSRKGKTQQLQGDEERLPRMIESLKTALEEGRDWSSLYFKMVKYTKMRIKLLTRLLSRQMTLAEIQAEFYTLSRFAMEIAEDWLEEDPDATKRYMDWVNASGWASQYVDGDNQAKAWSVDYC